MIDGFSLLKEEKLSYFNGKGIWVKHDRTGLNIFKFQTEKMSNHFSFYFSTPIHDDRGIAHILEHCILQGSKNFPDPELYSRLERISPSKIINAATSRTYTSFFAETCVPKDFYNLLEIMGDSVFFPLLTDESFLQEGWRIEFDDDGKPVLNGVVYNEMNNDERKSSFHFFKSNRIFAAGSDEFYIQGGDPLHITECSVEDIREFHKKNYVPANCLLFLFGNMDLDEQLKFLDEKLLCRLPSGTTPARLNDNIIPLTETKDIHITCPHYGTDEYTLEFRFCMKDGDREEILIRDDFFNLLNYALSEELMNPKYGSSADVDTYGTSRHRMFSLTLYNVAEKDIPSAKKYVESLLDDIAQNGIRKDLIENFCINMDYNYEDNEFDVEATSLNDPCFTGFVESGDPFVNLVDPETFWIENRKLFIEDKNGFCKSLVKKYLTENPHKAWIIMKPDAEYFHNIENEQKKAFEKLLSVIPTDEIKANADIYRKYQQDSIDGKFSIKLPELKVSDLPMPNDPGLADVEFIETKNGNVQLFSSVQDIKRKTYITICFPIDVLTLDQLFILNEGISLIKKLGFEDYSVMESYDLLNNESVCINEFDIDDSKKVIYCKPVEEYENRNWLTISFSVFNRKLKEGLSLIKKYIFNKNFNDADAINTFKIQFAKFLEQDKDDKIKSYGLHYLEAQCSDLNLMSDCIKSTAVLDYYDKLRKSDLDDFVSDLFSIYEKVINSGAVINVFASKDQLSVSKNLVKDFVLNSGIGKLCSPLEENIFEIKKRIGLKENNVDGIEINSIVMKADNSSCIAMFKGSVYPSVEFTAENSLLIWFTNSVLYEQIRKLNGAYTVSAKLESTDSLVIFGTGKDPNPQQSIEIFQRLLKDLCERKFTAELTEQIITQVYGFSVGEISPKLKGNFSFERRLIQQRPEMRQQRLKNLLSLKPQDLQDAAKRIYEASKKLKAIIFTNDKSNITGKVIASI